MADEKQYGTKRESEPNVVKFVEDGNPSEITHAAWVAATFKGDMPQMTERCGKWCFFVAEKYIDNTWQNVRKNVEEGKLWEFAKASTAWRSKGGVYVVLVYTYDSDDEADVMRIRAHLREMGFKKAVPYKTDAQTRAGIYADTESGFSKYMA